MLMLQRDAAIDADARRYAADYAIISLLIRRALRRRVT